MGLPPRGWYEHDDQLRFWDGQNWTDQTMPRPLGPHAPRPGAEVPTGGATAWQGGPQQDAAPDPAAASAPGQHDAGTAQPYQAAAWSSGSGNQGRPDDGFLQGNDPEAGATPGGWSVPQQGATPAPAEPWRGPAGPQQFAQYGSQQYGGAGPIPQQAPWGGGPGQPPWVQQSTRRRPVWPFVVGGIALLVLLAIVVGIAATRRNASGGTATASGSPQSAGPGEHVYRGGSTTVGGMKFDIAQVTCGIAEIGSGALVDQPSNGQWCRADVTITNQSASLVVMTAGAQSLGDGTAQYSGDDAAMVYDPEANVLLTPPGQGQSVTGHMWFDVPNGFTPTQAIVSIDSTNTARIPLG